VTAVLVVDDDPQLLQALGITLRARNYTVVLARGGREALAAAAAQEPDLVVLDLGLPDLDGVGVIHALRGWSRVPIVVLSGRADGTDKVGALDAGADDYVTKPFRMDEFLARLRAVSRRTHPVTQPLVVPVGDYLVDLDARRVLARPGGTADADGAPSALRLTPTEWHLLDTLLRNPGKLVTHHDLLPRVGGPADHERAHYLREYISRLRHKLEPDPARPRHLITEPGMGYRFQPLTDSEPTISDGKESEPGR
jgi:two-component system KDP operon response regulator KdpE